MQMKIHGSEVYALFNKKFSSFALFDGKHGSSFVPYQVSSKYHAREQDKKFIVGLREWMIDHQNEIGSPFLYLHAYLFLPSNFSKITTSETISLCEVFFFLTLNEGLV